MVSLTARSAAARSRRPLQRVVGLPPPLSTHHSREIDLSPIFSVGLEEIDDGIWNVYFGPHKLGRLHERHMRIEDALGKLKRHL